jgi:hypothetical protein
MSNRKTAAVRELLRRIPRLLAAVSLAGTALLTKWLVPKFGLSPEVAHVVADIAVDWVVGFCLIAIAALKVEDNRKVQARFKDERARVEREIQPSKPSRKEARRG